MSELTRQEKLNTLRSILCEMSRVTIAFSGGVDSTFLAHFAAETLGAENVSAVTAVAMNFAEDEIDYARDAAARLGICHTLLEVELPELFFENPKDRCYHCKKAVFGQIIEAVSTEFALSGPESPLDLPVFCDGQNRDDEADYRPGSIAAQELGVRSPLNEAGLTKSEIRETMKEMGIDIWSKPAFACLASRIPYGTEITSTKLRAIYDIESHLRKNGFTQVRARLHDSIVRLELLPDEMQRFVQDRPLCEKLEAKAKKYGFLYITLDLSGYRMGILNHEK